MDKKQIEGVIENVELKKEGETNGKKWQIFQVTINGQFFSTFDWKYKQLVNQPMIFTYEEKITEKDGKQYINKNLVNLPRESGISRQEFEDLKKRVEYLENKDISIEDEIDINNLPF